MKIVIDSNKSAVWSESDKTQSAQSVAKKLIIDYDKIVTYNSIVNIESTIIISDYPDLYSLESLKVPYINNESVDVYGFFNSNLIKLLLFNDNTLSYLRMESSKKVSHSKIYLFIEPIALLSEYLIQKANYKKENVIDRTKEIFENLVIIEVSYRLFFNDLLYLEPKDKMKTRKEKNALLKTQSYNCVAKYFEILNINSEVFEIYQQTILKHQLKSKLKNNSRY